MVKNRAQKTSVDFHTYLVSRKPQYKYEKKIMEEFREKNDFLYLAFSYENSATYEQLNVKNLKVFIGGAVFLWKYET